jgi:phosphoribosylanthranilate isomerase
MKLKICGLFRGEDIDYVNEARPDFIGFVFAESRRQVSPERAAALKKRLAAGIEAAGVFVNAPVETIAALYTDGIISFAQLHGNEDAAYIDSLKKECARGRKGTDGVSPVQVIKTLIASDLEKTIRGRPEEIPPNADYYLIDSGAGSGKPFDWELLKPGGLCASWLAASGKPWFLAGGISVSNIKEAMSFNPFGIDISGGAETDGIKDREKILRITSIVKEGNIL